MRAERLVDEGLPDSPLRLRWSDRPMERSDLPEVDAQGGDWQRLGSTPSATDVALASQLAAEILVVLSQPLAGALHWLNFFRSRLTPSGVLRFHWFPGEDPAGARVLLALEGLSRSLGFECVGGDPEARAPMGSLTLKRSREILWSFFEGTSSDGATARDLFQRVYSTQIAELFWEWKYGQGRSETLLARRGSVVVAHYGVLIREMWFLGEPARALQVADVMVEAADRALITREGVFSRLARAFQALHFGCSEQYAFAFGFPTLKAMRIGERLGLYQTVDQVQELAWSSMKGSRIGKPIIKRCKGLEGYEACVTQLWGAMAGALPDRVLIRRDYAYLQMRYVAHPEYRYVFLLALSPWTRQPLGLFVVRRDADQLRLMDYIGLPGHLGRLIPALRRWMAPEGSRRLLAWTASTQRSFFEETDYVLTETELAIPANGVFFQVPPSQLRNRWWVSMGDTDFL